MNFSSVSGRFQTPVSQQSPKFGFPTFTFENTAERNQVISRVMKDSAKNGVTGRDLTFTPQGDTLTVSDSAKGPVTQVIRKLGLKFKEEK